MGWCCCDGLRGLARKRNLVRLLLCRKAAVGADLNMLWQLWDEVKMLMCFRMMDKMERVAGLYVSMNGTPRNLSVVMVVAVLCKSAFVSGDVLCACGFLSKPKCRL